MAKKYIVTLTDEERAVLGQTIQSGKGAARRLTRPRILLKADASAGCPAWKDKRIVEALDVGIATVERLRRQFVEEGLEAALAGRATTRQFHYTLDGTAEAHLVALACGKAPEGRSRWTLRLLAGKMVELEYVDAVSHETVRRVLKKTRSSRGRKGRGSSRRWPTPSSFARWKTCWTCTSVRQIRSAPWCAWTRQPGN